MEGRFPNGVLMALTNCTDPSREDEFNRWRDEVHTKDLQSTGLLTHATRFVNVERQPDQPQYANIYETYVEDMQEARKSFLALRQSLVDAGRMSDLGKTVAWGIFPRIGSTATATEGKPVRGLLINSQNCKDPAREEEFNDWYNNVHIPDILASGFFHSAYRYENAEPGNVYSLATPISGVLGKYINLYETDLDPEEASNGIRGERAKWEAMGHTNDLAEIKLRLLFRPIYPKS